MHAMFADGPGLCLDLEPGLQMVLAPNPSPMTGPGTNTYLLGETDIAIIDPGPDDPRHLAALIRAIGGRRVSHIIVTHSHLDHSPLALPLSRQMGAPVLAFGDTFAGRSPVMAKLAAEGMSGGGEGLDLSFRPDRSVMNREEIAADGWTLRVLHTPGHLGNHIALIWNDAVFVGDTVMDWSTSLVSPPDGDMADFMTSCRKLRDLSARVFYAGHGGPISTPRERVSELLDHRTARNAAIVAALKGRPATVREIVLTVYDGLDPGLVGAAARNVFAHLVALCGEGIVRASPGLDPEATFAIVRSPDTTDVAV